MPTVWRGRGEPGSEHAPGASRVAPRRATSAPPAGDAAIVAEAVTKDFARGRVRAVRGIDLRVGRGEIFGFLGPNGSGKTTTVRILTTILPPTSGRVVIDGLDAATDAMRVRARIGVTMQDVALDPLLDAWAHLKLQSALQGVRRSVRRARADELIERLGLSGVADRKVGTYSGGLKRRLDIALSLVHRPRVLFLDEPTVGLDPQSRIAVWDEVRRLASEEGVSVFLTTQYLEEADALADRVAILDRGAIVAEGTPSELKRELGGGSICFAPAPPDRSRVAGHLARFGATPDADGRIRCPLRSTTQIAEILRSLDDAGIAYGHVEVDPVRLEDVFLRTTGRSLDRAETAVPQP